MDAAESSFSLYDWTLTAAREAAVSMREMGDARDGIEARANGQFSAGVRAMLHWCRINEQLTLERHARHAKVFAGFERLSRVRPVLKRYQRLAELTQQLVIFAEFDADLPVKAEFVDVSNRPLAREWFLVVDSPNYKTLLAARDLDGFGPTGPLVGRRFAGLTLHDGPLIERVVGRLAHHASVMRDIDARSEAGPRSENEALDHRPKIL